MDFVLEIIKTEAFLIGIAIMMVLLIFLYISNIEKMKKLTTKYNTFMKKIGKGENIQESIEKYSKRVEEVEQENIAIKKYCQQLDNNIAKCIQKVGLVRYNAFKDTGSDLSFTLALLDEQNTGVILNGIYSRDMSNIYSKPIEKGISSYVLSEEEKEAINKAINIS